MGKLKKISIALILVISAASILIYFDLWSPSLKPISLDLSEKATILKVSFDNSTKMLSANVRSMDSKDLVFNVAIIEDSNHKTVATIVPFQAELPAYENTTITVNLSDFNLASGNYTLNLRTSRTYNFYSPTFAVQ